MTITNETILIALVLASEGFPQYKRQMRTRQDPNLVAYLRLGRGTPSSIIEAHSTRARVVRRVASLKGSTFRAHKALQSISTAFNRSAETLTDSSSELTAETVSTLSPDPDSPDSGLNLSAPLSAPEALKSDDSKIRRMTASITTRGVTSEKFGTQDGRPG
ncbi:hypothetical protein DID88_009423 [Monilinia fructigena]|uniref:Uncharacterized protein n=1 Tax=Monilinia fructigena TaxID=38457 RepID=A0A395INR2_9HELO|nr:hypothetical protein DID88_009423 [Monilinia fructigena]